jgi:ATP-dependent DNA ligase
MSDTANTRSPPPKFTQPQLSLLVKAPPSGPDWAHELKYDGYRIHARLVRGEARLLTRTGLDWTDRYEATAKAISALAVQYAYLDGELCSVRPDGTTSFSEIQAATGERRTSNLVYFVFDLLFLDGKNLTGLPLLERRRRPLNQRHGEPFLYLVSHDRPIPISSPASLRWRSPQKGGFSGPARHATRQLYAG